MSKTELQILNIAFFAFHSALVVFNVSGWIFRRTRKLNLACLSVTAISWFVMGIWQGVGYCILTDWHWQIRKALGIHDPDQSYIQLLVRVLTGWEAPAQLVDSVCLGCFVGSLAVSVFLNVRDIRAQRRDIQI